MDQFCWFHEFEHPFDGISDGWGCHAYQPWVSDDGRLRICPEGNINDGAPPPTEHTEEEGTLR